MSARSNVVGFVQALQGFLSSRGSPLPAALAGFASPNYDGNTSPFKDIQVGPEPATIMIADKSINIYVLFSAVLSRGGATVLTNNNAWSLLLPQLGLPQLHTNPDGSVLNVPQLLQHHYNLLFVPFEDLYRRNAAEKAQALRQMPRPPLHSAPSDATENEDPLAMKRKMEFEDGDAKRVRQKTEPFDSGFPVPPVTDPAPVGSNSSVPPAMATQPRPRHEPSRRKIEYVPLAREIDSYGGRDFKFLEKEVVRPWRDINDWGTIDIEALTMSIRSRLSTELSYALTTFALLSTMKGPNPDTGFRIFECPELLEEVLDLVEDTAFLDEEDSVDLLAQDSLIVTNRQLVNRVVDLETEPFAGLNAPPPQRSKGSGPTPRQRPGSIILTVLNIIRNLCIFPDNAEFVARHPRVLPILLRLCGAIWKDSAIQTPSPAIHLNDLVVIRKDTLHVLYCISPALYFADASKSTLGIAQRIFMLIASYLVDPAEAVSPFTHVQLVGVPAGTYNLKPPSLSDMALEVFTRVGHSDHNRHVFSKAVSQISLYNLFVSLVHRLPVVDADFQLLSREPWLSFIEKVIMALYALAFLAPPDLKERLKNDRSLGLKNVVLRMVQKLSLHNNPEMRSYYMVPVRRAIETMKVLDDAKDSFDTSASTVTTISFGMGYGEVGENDVEKGTGLFGGHMDSTWEMLSLREVNHDDQLFAELDSLTRVEY